MAEFDMGRRLHLADLVGTPVVAADGSQIGKVVDIEVQPLAGFHVSAIVVARFSFLGRFALIRGGGFSLAPVAEPRRIPWSEVDRFDGRLLFLHPRPEARRGRMRSSGR